MCVQPHKTYKTNITILICKFFYEQNVNKLRHNSCHRLCDITKNSIMDADRLSERTTHHEMICLLPVFCGYLSM